MGPIMWYYHILVFCQCDCDYILKLAVWQHWHHKYWKLSQICPAPTPLALLWKRLEESAFLWWKKFIISGRFLPHHACKFPNLHEFIQSLSPLCHHSVTLSRQLVIDFLGILDCGANYIVKRGQKERQWSTSWRFTTFFFLSPFHIMYFAPQSSIHISIYLLVSYISLKKSFLQVSRPHIL